MKLKSFPLPPERIAPLYRKFSKIKNKHFAAKDLKTSSKFKTYFFRSGRHKVIEAIMYEPVPIQCAAAAGDNVTNLVTKLDVGGFCNNCTNNRIGVFDYTNPNFNSNQFDKNRSNDSSRNSNKTEPEKPPRRIRKSFFNRDLDEEGAGSRRNMRNGTGECTGIDVDHINLENSCKKSDATVQTSHLIPYRLRFWPSCDFKLSPSEKSCSLLRLKCVCRVLSQWFLSQFGLTIIVIIWALLGAYAFFQTEGPRELEQSAHLAQIQNDLSVELATDLKQTKEHEEVWLKTIRTYLSKHEVQLLEAVSAGYGEGGGGSIWTYPGCILFAVSLLTTLGFGAPVPRTTLGRGAAVLFSAVGIPLHFLLILNMGNLAAIKLQQFAFHSPTSDIPSISPQPRWLKFFPFLAIAFYYLLGVLLFGFIRQRPVPDSFMFPLDFTAAGGVATVEGYVRILYALYLEVAVSLAALVVSLIQASASRGIVDIGLRLGLLTNT